MATLKAAPGGSCRMQLPLLCRVSKQSEWVLNMNKEIPSNVQRVIKVAFFTALAAIFVWRANSYTDPRGFTGVPQTFLCLTGLIFGVIAFSIALGYGGPDPETE